MAIPDWPAVNYRPERPSFQPIKMALPPLTTEFEQGNERQRPRPGDNVGTVGQTIWMTLAEAEVFKSWVKNTLNLGTGRFRAKVWLGTSYEEKVCQFTRDGKPAYAPVSRSRVAVSMTLRVYGV
ncbi:hypothetical protein DYI24_01165 [Rhodopseudomonas sp. BR0C11]|uniref:hypothetical protein n=1 Tax=Rhodopseudomonas sp. BR0C11 TaxID=2269370 RepID=UPI0013DF59B4|nr:hypothetical protein [Rhodopseudomonas sp. BR0C11]NEV75655.1 hypothetical protein [Rhodopseudomonas sp. BR0C11]